MKTITLDKGVRSLYSKTKLGKAIKLSINKKSGTFIFKIIMDGFYDTANISDVILKCKDSVINTFSYKNVADIELPTMTASINESGYPIIEIIGDSASCRFWVQEIWGDSEFKLS